MSHDGGGAYVAQGVSDRQSDFSPPGEVHLGRAEEIYYAAISRRWTFKACCIEAKHLERECPEAAEYLRWLIARETWPRVKGRDGAQAASREDLELEAAVQ